MLIIHSSPTFLLGLLSSVTSINPHQLAQHILNILPLQPFRYPTQAMYLETSMLRQKESPEVQVVLFFWLLGKVVVVVVVVVVVANTHGSKMYVYWPSAPLSCLYISPYDIMVSTRDAIWRFSWAEYSCVLT